MGVYGRKTGSHRPLGHETVKTDAAGCQILIVENLERSLQVSVRPLIASGLGNAKRSRLVL